MNNHIRLKIGEFSKLMHVTVRTLRHYEQIGLLTPDEVDEWTGYRFYKVEQMHQLNTILRFKEIGFSLDEIKNLLKEESLKPDQTLLEKKIAECDEELQRITTRRQCLEKLLQQEKKIESIKTFSIQSIPAMTVASYTAKMSDSADMERICNEIIAPELQRLGCKRMPGNVCFTLYHGTEFSEASQEFEYCEEVNEAMADSKIIKFKQLPAIPQAICMAIWGGYEKLPLAFPDLYSYIENNGYKIDGDPRLCFINGPGNEADISKWLTIVQMPIENI